MMLPEREYTRATECALFCLAFSWSRDSRHVCSGTYDNKLQVCQGRETQQSANVGRQVWSFISDAVLKCTAGNMLLFSNPFCLQVWDTFSEGTTQLECTTAASPARKNSFKGLRPPNSLTHAPHRMHRIRIAVRTHARARKRWRTRADFPPGSQASWA